jgi:hypothetical protein
MPIYDEKRNKTDRRVRDDGPPSGCRERRNKRDRRQTEISEISFHEWTHYLLRFKKRAIAKAAAKQAAQVAHPATDQALDLSTVQNISSPQQQEGGASDVHGTPTIPS